VFLDHDRAMTDDLELQKALARIWNLEHVRGRITSPDQVRVRWDEARTRAECELCDAAGVIATATLHFQLVEEAPALNASTSEAAIKTYMAAAWNKKSPHQPTSEATIRVEWVGPGKAEIDIGNRREVFAAAEWTNVRNFPPIISGPYSVPVRRW
jgi:hypothetical protein